MQKKSPGPKIVSTNYFFSISISSKKIELNKFQKKLNPSPKKIPPLKVLFFPKISFPSKQEKNWINKFQKKLRPLQNKKPPAKKIISKNLFFLNFNLVETRKKNCPPPKKNSNIQNNFNKLFILNFNFVKTRKKWFNNFVGWLWQAECMCYG